MIFKGTDKKAFAKAGKEKTPKERSARYQREKRKNEIKGAIKDIKLCAVFKFIRFTVINCLINCFLFHFASLLVAEIKNKMFIML